MRIDSRFALSTSHVSYHAVQPRDSSRLIRYHSAFDIGSSRGIKAARHPSKPSASLRFTILPRPMRSFIMNSARSIAIASHAPKPRDKPRLSM